VCVCLCARAWVRVCSAQEERRLQVARTSFQVHGVCTSNSVSPPNRGTQSAHFMKAIPTLNICPPVCLTLYSIPHTAGTGAQQVYKRLRAWGRSLSTLLMRSKSTAPCIAL